MSNQDIQQLLFFISDDFDDSLVNKVFDFINSMLKERTWSFSSVEFVNQIDLPVNSSLDNPVWILGGMFYLYKNVNEIEKKQYDDVDYILNKLSEFSKESGHEWEIELDYENVGTIKNGKLDKSLKEGLLGEWSRHLID